MTYRESNSDLDQIRVPCAHPLHHTSSDIHDGFASLGGDPANAAGGKFSDSSQMYYKLLYRTGDVPSHIVLCGPTDMLTLAARRWWIECIAPTDKTPLLNIFFRWMTQTWIDATTLSLSFPFDACYPTYPVSTWLIYCASDFNSAGIHVSVIPAIPRPPTPTPFFAQRFRRVPGPNGTYERLLLRGVVLAAEDERVRKMRTFTMRTFTIAEPERLGPIEFYFPLARYGGPWTDMAYLALETDSWHEPLKPGDIVLETIMIRSLTKEPYVLKYLQVMEHRLRVNCFYQQKIICHSHSLFRMEMCPLRSETIHSVYFQKQILRRFRRYAFNFAIVHFHGIGNPAVDEVITFDMAWNHILSKCYFFSYLLWKRLRIKLPRELVQIIFDYCVMFNN